MPENDTKDCREQIVIDTERVVRLEADMEHTQEDVGEIKKDIREIKESNKNVEIAIVELAEIARTNQRLFPRLEAVEKAVDQNNIKLATWGGGLAVLIFLLGFFGSDIKTAGLSKLKNPSNGQGIHEVQREATPHKSQGKEHH